MRGFWSLGGLGGLKRKRLNRKDEKDAKKDKVELQEQKKTELRRRWFVLFGEKLVIFCGASWPATSAGSVPDLLS